MPNTQILTQNFKYRLINSLLDSIKEDTNNLYFFYARPFEINDDSQIEKPENSTAYQTAIKSNILSLKRINAIDLALGTKRYEWLAGTKYVAYDDALDLSDKRYFIITDEGNVYLCLNNNNTVSTYKPTSTSTEFIVTEDGYVWKYLYTVSSGLQRKFNINEYIPLFQDENVKNNAIPGTINRIEIIINDDEIDHSTLIPNIPNIELDEIPLFIQGTGDVIRGSTINVMTNASGNIVAFDRASFRSNEVEYKSIGDKWVPVQFVPNHASVTKIAYGMVKLDQTNRIDNEKIFVINGGEGYASTACEIMQSSCIAYAKFDTNNKLTRVEIPEYGENFTTAEVVPIVSPELVEYFSFRPIVSPSRGYGYNVFLDTRASTLLINVRIAYEEIEGNFTTQNNFRTIGLIDAVHERSSNGDIFPAISSTLSGMTTLEFENANEIAMFELNSLITASNGAVGKIVDKYDKYIRIIQNVEDTNSIEFIAGYNIQNRNIINVNKSSYVAQSGSILFIDNRLPIERHPDQIETINLILNI